VIESLVRECRDHLSTIRENVDIALKAIWANRLRSTLTTLGIIIGVAAVIAVVSLVQGMQHGIAKELQGVGATYILVLPDPARARGAPVLRIPVLTYEDGKAVRDGVPEVREFSPVFTSNVELKCRDTRHPTLLFGVLEAYQEVANHWVDRGRFVTPLDVETRKRVCVIGTEVARRLGLEGEPLGQVVLVNGIGFTVVGVMESKGSTFGQDRDDLILVPFRTATLIYGTEAMRTLRLDFQVHGPERAVEAKEQITELLRARHRIAKGQPNDFRIILQQELLKTISKSLLMVSLIMGAVVGIALLVGGIGIMNIMLVSVTERTREIGIRKAIGARRKDVLVQFLTEAVTLSAAGGIVGILGGLVLAVGARWVIVHWVEFPPVHTPIWSVVLAFGFSAALGIFFGFYPARKASRLDPIDAMRYE
jgi:putative ABC transport system permease protein